MAHSWAPPNEGEFSPHFASTLVVVQSFVSLAGWARAAKGVSLISEFHSDDSQENVGDAKLFMTPRQKILQKLIKSYGTHRE